MPLFALFDALLMFDGLLRYLVFQPWWDGRCASIMFVFSLYWRLHRVLLFSLFAFLAQIVANDFQGVSPPFPPEKSILIYFYNKEIG